MRSCCLCVAFLYYVAASAAAQSFDPAYRFRTLPTAHFRIHFHQGEDHLAARLAAIAEETWRALEQSLLHTPPSLTHVVLVDQSDSANGYATPLPRNIVVIYPVWPSGSEFLNDDWLRLVFIHEFTHVIHLDRSEGWSRPVRGVFGRNRIVLPNLFLPAWQIEGLATYEESALTGLGRLNAGDFRAVVGEAARARRLDPIDRSNGGLTDWPGGQAAYAYGLAFHEYLAGRFGAETFAALSDATARSIPFLGFRAFGQVYGGSLSTLWQEFQRSLPTDSGTAAPDVERLTHQGFLVTGPRFVAALCPAPPGSRSCGEEIWYSASDPNRLPALHRVRADGSEPERVATRYLGSTIGAATGTIYFTQQEIQRNAALHGDLYVLDRTTGHIRRLTRDARLGDLDVSPDGRTVVAVQNRPGQRDLVLIATSGPPPGPSTGVEAPTTLQADPEMQFNAPRWSPDGRSIAVERQRRGSLSEIVVVDVATRAVRVVATAPKVRWITPAWRPDGLAIVAAADLDEDNRDRQFNLYEIDLATERTRQLTRTSGGARWPDISPDGKTIVYVGYTTDGFDLFRIPYPAEGSVGSPAVDRRTASDERAPVAPSTGDEVSRAPRYVPWSTLAPTSWSPIIEFPTVRLGAATGGVDVLGYHSYSVSASWHVTRPAVARSDGAAMPDWSAAYAYTRWRPALWATAERETSFLGDPAEEPGEPSISVLRERRLELGVRLPVDRVRVSYGVLASIVQFDDELDDASRRRRAVRAGWWFTSAHQHGYSVSAERGVAIGVSAEVARPTTESPTSATTLTGDVRAYVPGLAAHHVLAIRASGGGTIGDLEVGRLFLLGGADSNLSLIDFDSGAMSLLRGFGTNTFAGRHVALLNADYRFPLARPQRGAGVWPLFLHTLHGALFADAGHVWTQSFSARDLKSSFGAELSARVVAGFVVPLNLTVGGAWGRDGSRMVPDGSRWYLRAGYAF